MLRYLYLLSLLLCIELTLCYNYIDEITEQNLNKISRSLRRDRDRRFRRTKERKSLLRQDYDYDRSPVEFDVASFIQPDYEAVEDDDSSRQRNSKKRRRISKSFDYGTLIGDDTIKRDKNIDYLINGDIPSDLSRTFSKDTASPKHLNYNSLDDLHSEKYGNEKFRNIYKDDLLLDQNIVHNHEKKCTLKHIKFPFFSHNKSETVKPKKNKKRRLFCFNCPKNDERSLKTPDDNKMIDNSVLQHKIKRSYEERLCPACKKLFAASLKLNSRPKKAPSRVIHNSRQFYQTLYPENKLSDVVKRQKNPNFLYSDEEIAALRIKREDARDRQLKELEDVQRKIDAVEIRMPTFGRPAAT